LALTECAVAVGEYNWKGVPVMDFDDGRYLRRRPQHCGGPSILAAAVFAAILMVSAAPASYSYSLYSGSSVGANGTVYGWGVTDGTPPPGFQMIHTAYVKTTLTSPNGRTAYSGSLSGSNWRRGDVSLAFDANDLGTYYIQSFHGVYCPVWGWIIGLWVAQSNSQKTVCDFDINGAAHPTCDGRTRAYTIYQAAIRGGCTAVPFPYGSNLTFGASGSVDPDYNASGQRYQGVPPALDAYYYAGPGSGAVIPQFTIKFAEGGNTMHKERTDAVCQ
jgi:hypothetical protein